MLVDLAPADKNINQMENINVAKHKKRVLRNAGLTLDASDSAVFPVAVNKKKKTMK